MHRCYILINFYYLSNKFVWLKASFGTALSTYMTGISEDQRLWSELFNFLLTLPSPLISNHPQRRWLICANSAERFTISALLTMLNFCLRSFVWLNSCNKLGSEESISHYTMCFVPDKTYDGCSSRWARSSCRLQSSTDKPVRAPDRPVQSSCRRSAHGS